MMTKLRATFRRLEQATRPVHPRTRGVLEDRWANLPAGVRTAAQALGRHAVGCEGTHGVFGRCNLSCTLGVLSREVGDTGW